MSSSVPDQGGLASAGGSSLSTNIGTPSAIGTTGGPGRSRPVTRFQPPVRGNQSTSAVPPLIEGASSSGSSGALPLTRRSPHTLSNMISTAAGGPDSDLDDILLRTESAENLAEIPIQSRQAMEVPPTRSSPPSRSRSPLRLRSPSLSLPDPYQELVLQPTQRHDNFSQSISSVRSRSRSPSLPDPYQEQTLQLRQRRVWDWTKKYGSDEDPIILSMVKAFRDFLHVHCEKSDNVDVMRQFVREYKEDHPFVTEDEAYLRRKFVDGIRKWKDRSKKIVGVPLSMDREVKKLVTQIKRDERARDGTDCRIEEDAVQGNNTITTVESRRQTLAERDLSRAEMVRSELQPPVTQSQTETDNVIPTLPSNRSAQLERDGEDLMEYAVGNR